MTTRDHPTIEGSLTTVRPVREEDFELLAAWLSDPDIYVWWGGEPIGPDEVRSDYTGRRSPEVESFIVESDGEPVGYLQYWRSTARSGGVDMFLVPQARGRGLGPDAARGTVDYLFREEGWVEVTVDPLVENERAIRAWSRAG